MADSRNLVLQLLITARDEASSVFGKVFSYLDDNTKVVAGKIRDAFTGLFSGGLSSAMDLEAAFDAVAAKGGYTAQEMEGLKKSAADVAAQFGVTGLEAAQGLEILAAAGLSAKDAVATLPQVLALARSEGVSMEVAAERLSDSLSVMGLGFDQAGRMADVLAKGANLSTVSATQLAESLSKTGGIAKAAGLDLETTVAALDLLAKNGMKGEVAGTGLAAVLTQLQNPASTASAALNAMGISTRDLGEVLDALRAGGASSEAAILAFGETAGPALRALISEGSAGINAFSEQLRNADGAALDASKSMSDNLKSAFGALSAAWESVRQSLAEPLLEPLAKAAKTLADAFTDAVKGGAFSGLADAIRLIAVTASDTAIKLIAAFDFKVIGASINSLVSSGFNALGQAMNNVGAIAGALAAGAIIPLVAGIRTAITATLEWITAKRALAASMTAAEIASVGFSRALSVLAGPTGWILAGVSALVLLWKEEDKTKAMTDALAISAEDYTKKLKEQTAAQNQVALNNLNDALDVQRQKLQDAKIAYDQASQGGRDFIVVTEDHGAILGKTTRVITDAAEIERIRQERLAAVDDQTQRLNETEKRRQQIVDELKAKQEAANPATAAAESALGKYRKAVDEATAAQAAAQAELDKLTPGTIDYGIAAGKAASADQNLKLAKEVLEKAQSDYNAAVQQSIRELPDATAKTEEHAKAMEEAVTKAQQGVTSSKAYSDAVKGVVDAQNAGLRAEISLAAAKGNTTEVQELTKKLAIQEADGSVLVANAKQAEQVAEYALAIVKRNQLLDIQNKTEAQKQELVIAELVVQKELLEAQAAGVNAEAQKKLADALHNLNGVASEATASIDKDKVSTDNNTQSKEKHVKVVDNVGKMYMGLIIQLQGARQRMDELSATAGAYFEAILQGTLNQNGLRGAFESSGAAAEALNRALENGGGSSGELAKYEQAASQAAAAQGRLKQEILFSVNQFDMYATAIEMSEAATRKLYFEQAAGAEQLRLSIESMLKSGQVNAQDLQLAAQAAAGDFKLLDDQDLAGLRSAIDSANDKLREMQEITQSARDKLASLNADLLEAQGQDQKAELLRQQLDYQQQLAEIERQRQEAENAGNTEALSVLNQQRDVLEEINRIKTADIQNTAQQTQQTRTATSSASSSAAAASSAPTARYEIKLTAGAKTLTASTDSNPQSFLDELENAQRLSA